MRSVFIFKYGDMRLGGIQTILYNHVKYAFNKGLDVIWIIPHKTDIHPGFKDVINNESITICTEKNAYDQIYAKHGNEKCFYISYSFKVQDYFFLDDLLSKLDSSELRNYLVIANYQGKNIYLEENLSENKRTAAYHAMRDFYKKLLLSGQLLFCAAYQAKTLSEHYDLSIEEARLIPETNSFHYELNETLLTRRYHSRNILTLSRFDFPHKSYILGLIDVFSQIAASDNSITLTIIGYGSGDCEVENRISQQPNEIAKRIKIIHGVSPDKLESCFENATIFVGLAGALLNAASYGVVSLVARHFSPKCEVYGYYTKNSEKSVCSEAGYDLSPYLKDALQLSLEEYVAESANTKTVFDAYIDKQRKDFTTCYPVRVPTSFSYDEKKILSELSKGYNKTARDRRLTNFMKSPIYNIKRMIKRYFKG